MAKVESGDSVLSILLAIIDHFWPLLIPDFSPTLSIVPERCDSAAGLHFRG